MGNKIDIDYDKLYQLAEMGLSEAQIATSMGISESTIARRKRDDDRFDSTLKAGKQAGITEVTNSLFQSATGDKPNTSAQIFFLKNRAGWRDKTELDANVSGSVVVDHDVETALQSLKDAGIDPTKL